jgi:phosphate transport system permease protein
MTAAEPRTDVHDLGRISRVRGAVFGTVTKAASAVGVVALALLLVYVSLDAIKPLTADPAWHLAVVLTVVVPTAALAVYARRNAAFGGVALRSVGAAMAGVALATLLVLWLGGQLALVSLVAVVLPTLVAVAVLARRRDALAVGLRVSAIAVAGGTVAVIGSLFLGPQGALVFAVAVGVPAALLVRYFLTRPAQGSVGVHGIAAGLLAVAAIWLIVEAATALAGVSLGEAAVGVYAAGAVVGIVAYGAYARAYRASGHLGLAAPFVLLAGTLAGYLFHRSFVITVPVTPLLYGVTAGLPALAVVARSVADETRGRAGLVLPVVPVVGAGLALAFHRSFVVTVPTAVATFGLATVVAYGASAAVVLGRNRPGRSGLIAPVVLGAGLLAGLGGTRAADIAGPETWLDVGFLTRSSHYDPALAGIHPSLVGSFYLMVVVAVVAFPVGVGAAIYLEEYAPDNRWTRLVEINIANLAGVPSVVYGLLGVGVFVRYGGLPLGAVVVGGFTLSLLILPIVIISAQEAIRAVPDSLRQASYGMGATRLQTVRTVVLPRAVPGILTGTILALGRAVGETAPLLMVGLAAIGGVPDSLTGQGTAMPLQVFSWALDARPLFRENVAAAGAVTLLAVMLTMNGVAIVIRNRYQRDT